MMRVRKNGKSKDVVYTSKMGTCVAIKDQSDMHQLGQNPNVYIQNVTPVYLLDQLIQHLPKPPERILDLCAAPGGKILALTRCISQCRTLMQMKYLKCVR